MRVEVPTFKKCCFCVPLRYGLLIWGYLKLITAAVYTVLLGVIAVSQMVHDVRSVVIIWVAIVLCLVDLSFSIVFVVGAHKKDYRLIRVFYRFALTALIIYVLLIATTIGIQIYKVTTLTDAPSYVLQQIVERIIEQGVVFFLNIVLQMYLLFLTRSEVLKLKANCQFQFVNNAAESHCQLKNANGVVV